MILKSCYLGGRLIFETQEISLNEDAWTCVTGQSGVGKTTFLRCLAGLIPGFSPIQPHLSYMPQALTLFPWKTIIQNITISQLFNKKRENSYSGEEILSWVGLGDCASFYPHQLSFGMQKRVLLAQVLYDNAPLVLLDEPFAGIDPITRASLYQLCQEHFKNRTVLQVTHDPEDVKVLANSVWHLSGSPAMIEVS